MGSCFIIDEVSVQTRLSSTETLVCIGTPAELDKPQIPGPQLYEAHGPEIYIFNKLFRGPLNTFLPFPLHSLVPMTP